MIFLPQIKQEQFKKIKKTMINVLIKKNKEKIENQFNSVKKNIPLNF